MERSQKWHLGIFFGLLLVLGVLLTWNSLYLNWTHFRAGSPPEPTAETVAKMPRLPPLKGTDPMSGGTGKNQLTVVMYGDYFSNASRVADGDLLRIQTLYKDRVRIVWKDLPNIQARPDAAIPALAARCADQQGRFWSMHDKLMTSAKLDYASLRTYAGELGLDTEAFNSCLDKGKPLDDIQLGAAEAAAYDITVSPTIFVAKRVFVGPTSADDLMTAVKHALP
jgi:protein-disulfide isomerase